MTPETLKILDDFTHSDTYPPEGSSTPISMWGYDYLLVTEVDGEEKIHTRINQPCYGEMRIYPTKWKPSDLHHPFPDGKPIGVAIRLKHFDKKASGWQYIFSDDSLWSPILKDRVVKTGSKKSDGFDGIIMKDLEIDSDYWFSFLLTLRTIERHSKIFDKLVEKGAPVQPAWVSSMLTTMQNVVSPVITWQSNPSSYSMAYPSNFKNLLNKTPDKYQDGLMSDRATLRQQPDNMASRIWKGKDSFSNLEKQHTVSLDKFVAEYIPYMESFR